jgi:hypothetical protein
MFQVQCGKLKALGRLSLVEFSYSRIHFLAGLEADKTSRWDVDDIPRSGISAYPAGSSFDLKNSKIPEFDSAFFDERCNQCVECSLNSFLGFCLREI